MYTILDNLEDIIEGINPDALPSVIQRQEAAELKQNLVQAAKDMGYTWSKEDCGGTHTPFLVSRANRYKCALCGENYVGEIDSLRWPA